MTPPVVRRVVRPLTRFLATEAAGGVLLLAATAAALAWANIDGDSYDDAWSRGAGVAIGSLDRMTVHAWINDALMTLFFFVVGLEIRRELLRGELRGARRAALPAIAALGGMAVPALLYLAVNAGGGATRGWGVPMATDIAFVAGAMALLGRRVPASLKVFVLALAIVDDIGAIAVIALFYTDGLSLGWLAAAVGTFAVTAALSSAGVRSLAAYAALALVAWFAMHESGVHATIAGVAMALLIPTGHDAGGVGATALDRLEHLLHPWSSYAVVPLFALANAGVPLGGDAVRDALDSRVALGIALGLVVGKPAGILLFSAIAVVARAATLPRDASWAAFAGVAMIAGIGFTVSIFIAGLAFAGPATAGQAKIGILGGSALSAAGGVSALALAARAKAH